MLGVKEVLMCDRWVRQKGECGILQRRMNWIIDVLARTDG